MTLRRTSTVSAAPLLEEEHNEKKGRVVEAPALLLALIHRSAWKGNSANFAFTEFSEVHYLGDAQRTQPYI